MVLMVLTAFFFFFTALFSTRHIIIQILKLMKQSFIYENTDVSIYLMTEFGVFLLFHCWRDVNGLIEVDVWLLCFPQGTSGSVHLLRTCVLSETETHGPR